MMRQTRRNRLRDEIRNKKTLTEPQSKRGSVNANYLETDRDIYFYCNETRTKTMPVSALIPVMAFPMIEPWANW